MFRTRSKILAVFLLAAFTVAGPTADGANPFRGSSFQLVESDRVLLEAAAQKLYLTDVVEVGVVEKWENPETGNRGTVTLIGTHQHDGLPCRRLQHDIDLKRTRDTYRFTVDRCRTADGEWKILAQ